MRNFILRRLLQTLPMLLLASFIIFLLFAKTPGDFIDGNITLTAARAAELKAIYGLDQPLLTRYLHWLPVGGMTNTGSDESGWQYVLQVAAHLALPVLALVMLQAGSLTRYVRASMLDVVKMDFIRTARAKGLQERTVILKHALRNALLPIITLLGFELPGLFSGAIITEKVFNWPGAGHIHIDSLAARDYPVLMGFTLFLAVLTIVGNLLADVLYAWADPRIRVRS
ncbi:ABC transporter permease [Klebsiella pneumoniae]|uniref:ABC transporter permease n=1 Tax=Klebsiella pneumoniae TaxID=573 RepID=UPI000E2D2E24|nr:ABC transporter permease [Klebsiella pneumoniae]SWU75322.1 Oligopeptide transport system permease OppB [Klebsiella pneumoniae]